MSFSQIVSIFIAIFLFAQGEVSQSLPTLDDQSLNYRLPNNSVPLFYYLRIETDIHNGADDFLGLEKIRIRITETTDVITLHCNGEILKIKSVDLYDTQDIIVKPALTYEIIAELDFLRIKLPSQVSRNTELILSITFQGVLNDRMPMGLYKTFFFDELSNLSWMIATVFKPTYARMAFPCYDEPQIRATFQLEIKHDKSYKAISNVPVVNRITADQQNYVITQFETTPLMQSYSLGFIVSKLDSIVNDNARLPQAIYADPEKLEKGHGEFALKTASEMHEKIVNLFGLQVPLKKLDHVAVPSLYTVVENLGLTSYDENILLLNPLFIENVLEYQKKIAIGFIAHEFMHQLMGNAAIQWWQFLWLHEGLATFYEYYISSLLYPKYDYIEVFRFQVLDVSFMRDNGNETMNDYVEAPEEISNKFNSISFEKAAVVIRMFHEALTPSTFTKGVRYYIENAKLQPATPDDLHRALQKSHDEDNDDEEAVHVGAMMASWENQPGFPILSVSRVGNDIVITQNRYMDSMAISYVDYPKYYNDAINLVYSIPLTYATTSNPNFNSTKAQLWMTTKSITIPNIGANDWIILNIQQVGYYRVDYSRDLWRTIIDGYNENPEIIHKINREVLHEEMYDGWINLRTKSISDCLELMGALEREREGAIWEKAGYYMEKLNDFFLFSEFYDDFLDMMHQVLNPHLDILTNDDQTSKLHNRVKLWCKESHHEAYLQLQLRQLLVFMNSGDRNDRPDFCSAFRVANSSVYQNFFDKAFDGEGAFDSELISSLGCSSSPQKLKDLFEKLLDSRSDLNGVIISITFDLIMRSSEVGLEAVMDFSYNRTGDISKVTQFPPKSMVMELSNLINSPRHLEKYKTLTNKLVYDGIMTRDETAPLLTAIEQKLQSPEWDDVKEWFEQRLEDASTSSSTSLRLIETTAALGSSALSTSIRIIAICSVIKGLLL